MAFATDYSRPSNRSLEWLRVAVTRKQVDTVVNAKGSGLSCVNPVSLSNVVVPVRYPLSEHSRATLERAIDAADDRDADLMVIHVNLSQQNGRVTRSDLKSAVGNAFGSLPRSRYVVRTGLLIEETILEEIAASDADVVVIGEKQVSRWRQTVRRLLDDPDVATYVKNNIDCQVLTVSIE